MTSPPISSIKKAMRPPAIPVLPVFQLFKDDVIRVDTVADEADSFRRHNRLVRLVWIQSIVIACLSMALVVGASAFQPVNRHLAVRPDDSPKPMVPLSFPNLTDQAILSWSTTSVAEIMRLGFGDFDKQIRLQRPRFTAEGWDSFVEALDRQGIRQRFKERQLVLTTVSSDTPVVTGKGFLTEEEYIWKVEVPIIMTYSTNNNVSRRSRSVIRLTIVRVPSTKENVQGIGIKSWSIS